MMNSTELVKRLSPVDLSAIKDSLLMQKGNILNKNKNFLEDNLSATQISDEAEAASHNVTTHITLNLLDRDHRSLMMIDRALSKIQEGTYGLCECCGEGISARRLFARPFTNLCIDCMEEQEVSRPSFQ